MGRAKCVFCALCTYVHHVTVTDAEQSRAKRRQDTSPNRDFFAWSCNKQTTATDQKRTQSTSDHAWRVSVYLCIKCKILIVKYVDDPCVDTNRRANTH